MSAAVAGVLSVIRCLGAETVEVGTEVSVIQLSEVLFSGSVSAIAAQTVSFATVNLVILADSYSTRDGEGLLLVNCATKLVGVDLKAASVGGSCGVDSNVGVQLLARCAKHGCLSSVEVKFSETILTIVDDAGILKMGAVTVEVATAPVAMVALIISPSTTDCGIKAEILETVSNNSWSDFDFLVNVNLTTLTLIGLEVDSADNLSANEGNNEC